VKNVTPSPCGLEALPLEWLEGRRVGLVAHPASRVSDGRHSAVFLKEAGVNLTALFGPEHGFFGRGDAGEKVEDSAHADWDIPIFSLYGETRAPTEAMLKLVDVVVFDLQTIACRAYTYVSTLRLMMEACAAQQKKLIVADRPDPLMLGPADGPMLDADCSSFVGLVPTPFCTGMTLGETAHFLCEELKLTDLDLRIAPCPELSSCQSLEEIFPVWHPCSPAIVSLENALCFPLTVFFEALPMIDHARGTPLAFQNIGSAHTDITTLDMPEIPGVTASPCEYPDKTGEMLKGWHFEVTDPTTYQPALGAFRLISALEKHIGPALWEFPGSRPEFYAQLWGTRTPAPPWPDFEGSALLY
jgi:uncharacterized protein YbbC (DUF1343 family)